MKLSILTATYNREKLLPNLYESIKKNIKSNLKCEWIVLDDGSTDNTKALIEKYQEENIIDIKYKYQKNSGKMVAINEAVKLSEGELIVECDSDDYFTENAFEIINKYAEKVIKNEKLYGMILLKVDTKGKVSGNKFKQNEIISTMFDLYFREDIQGEKIIVFNSKIRKEYTNKLENNEKFVTEARMYHEMDEKYSALCINEAIEIIEYQENGYTKNITEMFKKYPYGYYKYFEEILSKNMKGVILKKRLYAIKHFILFGVLTNKKMNTKNIKDTINKLLYIILYIPGIIKSKKF